MICDVGDEAAVKRAAEVIAEQFGGLDILVDNAGKHLVEYNVALTALPRPKWRTLFDVNVIVAAFFCCSDDAQFIPGDTLMVTGGHPLQI